MISRSTLIGALVVVELAIVGAAAQAIVGTPSVNLGLQHEGPGSPGSFGGMFAATGRLDKTLATGPSPHVVVDVHDIDVVLDARAAQPVLRATESLKIAGFVSGTATPIVASATPDGARITAGDSNFHAPFGSVTRTLHVAVPENARVEILSAGRIDATGLRTKFVAHSPDGSVHVRDHRGDLDVSTASGRIELVDVQGADIAVNTHEGRLYLTRVGADRIDAHSNFGRIYAVDLRVKDGALNTHSGRISASFTANSDATVKVSTGDGVVTVAGLPSTHAGTDKSTVQLGSGRGNFEVSTDEGAVNISQGANV